MKVFCCAICLFLAGFSYSQIPTTGLMAYFPFSGNANDSSGNGQDGTTYNVQLTDNRFGDSNSAYLFSGNTNSYIQFPAKYVLNNTYSFSLWCKTTAAIQSGSTNFMLEIGQGNNGTGQQLTLHNFYLGTYTGFTSGGYNMTSPNFGTSSKALPKIGEWMHVVSVRDSNYVLLFVNGKFIDSHGVANKILPNYGTNAKGTIGIRCDYSSPFKGAIDDVCIYDRAISKTEISQLYNIKTNQKYDFEIDNNLSIYPNPTDDVLHVKISNSTNEALLFTLFDLNGKLITHAQLNGAFHSINLGSLSNGIYLASVKNTQGKTLITKKIILAHY